MEDPPGFHLVQLYYHKTKTLLPSSLPRYVKRARNKLHSRVSECVEIHLKSALFAKGSDEGGVARVTTREYPNRRTLLLLGQGTAVRFCIWNSLGACCSQCGPEGFSFCMAEHRTWIDFRQLFLLHIVCSQTPPVSLVDGDDHDFEVRFLSETEEGERSNPFHTRFGDISMI